VNTTTILPTINVRDQGADRYLTFDWTDGQGHPDSVTLGLADMHADPTVHADIARNVERVIQHVWLMGYDQGSYEGGEAYANGYSLGGEDATNPYNGSDQRYHLWGEGSHARRIDNEAGQRIEALTGDRVQVQYERDELRRQLAAVTAERDAYERDAVNYREERDALADSLDHVQRDLITATSPVEGDETVTRAAYDSLAEQGRILLESRTARISELETDVTNARVVVEQVQNDMERRVRDMQTRIDERDAEWNSHRSGLLEEAERRGWCPEYEAWAKGQNQGKRYFLWELREKEYNVNFTVSYNIDTRELARCTDVYDVEVETYPAITVSASITCSEDDIEERVENLRNELESCADVDDVTLDGYEAE
jgi:chromosome segregation ATPase